MDLEWKEPPPKASGEVQQVVELLQQHPGKWARVVKNVSSTSAGSKWRKAGCEAAIRPAEGSREGKRRYDVYARWPKPKGGQAEAAQAPRQAVAPPPQKASQPAPAHSPATSDAGLNKYLAGREERQRKGSAPRI